MCTRKLNFWRVLVTIAGIVAVIVSIKNVSKGDSDNISMYKSAWIRYGKNPVIELGIDGSWDAGRILEPSVVFFNNQYYMYYSGNIASGSGGIYNWSVGLATSSDGYTWTKNAKNPVFTKNTSGFDSNAVWEASVIEVSSKLYMYYTSTNSAGELNIGMATSTNGIDWTRQGQVLTGAREPGVYYENGVFYLFYSKNSINLATSSDGITFARNEVVIDKTQHWEYHGLIECPSVTKISGLPYKYYMTYISVADSEIPRKWRIGLAYSNDLYTWTKFPEPLNPFFINGIASFESFAVTAPSNFIEIGKNILMYYDAHNGIANNQIGVATIPRKQIFPEALLLKLGK